MREPQSTEKENQVMVAMRSSNIAGADYDDDRKVLIIEFQSGSTYEYIGAGREYYEGLVSSPSPGSYFHRQIKDRFQSIKVG